MIQFDAVTKRYPDGSVAVHEFTLEVPTGQITVFVGPSGCGKTTTLRMVNRMTEPTSGRVLIDGRDLTAIKATRLRRGIGYVIQNAGLFPNRTIVDNVATVPRLLGQPRRAARRHALDLLSQVGLSAELGARYPAQLSGGQQQRVGVARALAADPPVLLMDEPFSAVDPVVREQLQNELLRLQHDLGKTIIFVTHDIDEAIKLGDHVAVMRTGGTLAQFAAPADLLTRPADSFVAAFVGRDRGYRALGFARADSLAVIDEQPVRLGDPMTTARDRQRDGWVLVVDTDRTPVGWLSPAGHRLDDTIAAAHLNLGGTLARRGESLREALDAALSSPSGRGVVVDEGGRLAGTVTAAQVLDGVKARAADGLARSARQGGRG